MVSVCVRARGPTHVFNRDAWSPAIVSFSESAGKKICAPSRRLLSVSACESTWPPSRRRRRCALLRHEEARHWTETGLSERDGSQGGRRARGEKQGSVQEADIARSR